MPFMKLIPLILVLAAAITASAETTPVASPTADAPAVEPTVFSTQVLEPTGGKIQRPKDWYYTEDHHGESYSWLLSPDSPMQKTYTTGVHIQIVTGVQAASGKSAKDYVLNYIAARKKEATKVIRTMSEASNQGAFTAAHRGGNAGREEPRLCIPHSGGMIISTSRLSPPLEDHGGIVEDLREGV